MIGHGVFPRGGCPGIVSRKHDAPRSWALLGYTWFRVWGCGLTLMGLWFRLSQGVSWQIDGQDSEGLEGVSE